MYLFNIQYFGSPDHLILIAVPLTLICDYDISILHLKAAS